MAASKIEVTLIPSHLEIPHNEMGDQKSAAGMSRYRFHTQQYTGPEEEEINDNQLFTTVPEEPAYHVKRGTRRLFGQINAVVCSSPSFHSPDCAFK